MRSLSLLFLVASFVVSFAQTPRLVVVISIDQCRADYLTRFNDHYLPASQKGFNYLIANGAHYRDAHFGHVPTATGPGHAVLLSGAPPHLSGIVGNEWYDRQNKREHYCVDDLTTETVGGRSKPMSPKALQVTTVGDELKMATGKRSKVVGIAYKDRASILMAGHAADTVVWFDDSTGNWVSSKHYCPDGKLPQWVQALNDEKHIDMFAGRTWKPLLPAEAYKDCRPLGNPEPFTATLPASPGQPLYKAFASSGYGNDYVFLTAMRAVEAEGLGADDTPDILAINLSTNDYIGHAFGPNSPQVLDISVRTDRGLSDFLKFLDKKVKGGLKSTLIAITADHGVAPVPEELAQSYRGPGKRIASRLVEEKVETALDKLIGPADWVLAYSEPHLYLNFGAIQSPLFTRESIEQAAADAALEVDGVYFAFTRTQLLNGRAPGWDWSPLVYNAMHPHRSGDLIVITAPNVYMSSYPTGTGHFTPWAYDTHVPLLLTGPGIKPGRYMRRVTTLDLAPTLSQLLNIEYPSGNMGKVLTEAVK
ncbi:MAG: alkaline phosphatase family protein [Armatimonadetes bacterium]|nr:alkaline phosphatase family protein [Armatimonadota bacterium]